MEILSEEEQLEAIKRWWKSYGFVTIFAVLFAIAFSFGWRYWRDYQQKHDEQASLVYEQLLVGYHNHQSEQVAHLAQELLSDYSRTPYAGLAALVLAKQLITAGQLAQASQDLQWVYEHAKSSELRQVARLRAARILGAQQQYAAALALLDKVDNAGYLPLIQFFKAQFNLQLGRADIAKQLLQQASAQLPANSDTQLLARLQLTQLGFSSSPQSAVATTKG